MVVGPAGARKQTIHGCHACGATVCGCVERIGAPHSAAEADGSTCNGQGDFPPRVSSDNQGAVHGHHGREAGAHPLGKGKGKGKLRLWVKGRPAMLDVLTEVLRLITAYNLC